MRKMRNLATWTLAGVLLPLVTVVEALIVSVSEIKAVLVGLRELNEVIIRLLSSQRGWFLSTVLKSNWRFSKKISSFLFLGIGTDMIIVR